MPGVPSLFTSLITFTGTSFFLGDEMHLICRGISQLVYRLIDPHSSKKFHSTDNTKQYTFALISSDSANMGTFADLVEESLATIPPVFEGSWDDVVGFYRAVDYLDFLLYVVPTIILRWIKVKDTQKAPMNLINGCLIALQWDISEEDLYNMDK